MASTLPKEDLWTAIRAGKLTELSQLQKLSPLLLARHPKDKETVCDILLRNKQDGLLQQVLATCPDWQDPVKLLILGQSGAGAIAHVLKQTRGPPDPCPSTLQSWQRSLVSSAPEAVWRGAALPDKEDWLPWLALSNPHTEVLTLVLQGVDPTHFFLCFRDGSNLLHEAVELTASADHLAVLVEGVVCCMRPADMMAAGHPLDRQFLDHMHEGKTALFKLASEYQQLLTVEQQEQLRREAAAARRRQRQEQKRGALRAQKAEEKMLREEALQAKAQEANARNAARHAEVEAAKAAKQAKNWLQRLRKQG